MKTIEDKLADTTNLKLEVPEDIVKSDNIVYYILGNKGVIMAKWTRDNPASAFRRVSDKEVREENIKMLKIKEDAEHTFNNKIMANREAKKEAHQRDLEMAESLLAKLIAERGGY